MSRRADLKARIHSLGEIKSILGAMKNLSIIEMNKVSRYLGAQNELATAVEEALGDFERFFPEQALRRNLTRAPHEDENAPGLYILLGSERGLCGGFNQAIRTRFDELVCHDTHEVRILTVGRKLASLLEGDPRLLEALDGPSAAEEIASVIAVLARSLQKYPGSPWTLLHHGEGGAIVEARPYALAVRAQVSEERFPPLLNLTPDELYPQLFEQYLFSILYRGFYLSFLAENRERLRHMDGALGTLEKEWDKARTLSNSLRQEEITEEIELILLSVDL